MMLILSRISVFQRIKPYLPSQISPTRTLVRPYTRISPIQLRLLDCLAFPDSHSLPQVAVFWIQLTLLTLSFYCSSSPWVILIAIISAHILSFPHLGSFYWSPARMRSSIHKYPCFVLSRASLRMLSA